MTYNQNKNTIGNYIIEGALIVAALTTIIGSIAYLSNKAKQQSDLSRSRLEQTLNKETIHKNKLKQLTNGFNPEESFIERG